MEETRISQTKPLFVAIAAIMLCGVLQLWLWSPGENIYIPSEDAYIADPTELSTALYDRDLINQPYPSTHYFSPLGTLSLDSDFLLADILAETDDIRFGISLHNTLFLVGAGAIIVLIAYSLGMSLWMATLLGMVTVLFPMAGSSLPLIHSRPWLMALFWQSVGLLAFIQSVETRNKFWYFMVFVAILIAGLSLPSAIGLGIGISTLILLHHDRESERSPKPLILASSAAVFIFFIFRMVSSIDTPNISSSAVSQSFTSLGSSLIPLSSTSLTTDNTFFYILGWLAFLGLVFLCVRGWFTSEKDDPEEGYRALNSWFSVAGTYSDNLKGKTVFLFGTVAMFHFFFSLFELNGFLSILGIQSVYFQAVPVVLPFIYIIFISLSKFVEDKVLKPFTVIISLLYLFAGFQFSAQYTSEASLLSSLGLEDDYLSSFYLDESIKALDKNDHVLAFKKLELAESLGTDNPAILKQRAKYHIEIKDYVQAEKFLEKYISSIDSLDKEAELMLVNFQILNEEFEEAETRLESVLEKSPNDIEALSLMSAVHLKQDEFREAATWAREAIAEGQQLRFLAQEFLNYGVQVFDKNENKALEAWDLSGQLDPSYITPYEKFLVYYVEYYPDFRRALWCVEQIRKRGGDVDDAVMARIREITPPSLRPDEATFQGVL